MILEELKNCCLIFPFSRINANAISVLLASLDIHPILKSLKVILPNQKTKPDEINGLQDIQSIILAFSVFSTQFEDVIYSVKQYRSFFKNKRLFIVAGGPHPIGDPKSMLENGVDIVCTGEGESIFSKIILNHLTGLNMKNILGIAYLNEENNIVKTLKPPPINLDDFPPFSIKHKLIRPIEITRGCAWKCRFCQVRNNGTRIKHRSIHQIIKYVRITIEYFSRRRPDIRFISPNALSYASSDGKIVNLVKLEELLLKIREIIGEHGNIYFGSFPSEIRPETISKESVALLSKYTNAKKIKIGGQSGSNQVLKHIARGHDVEETERAAKLLIDAGFEVDVDIIFGLPSEAVDDVDLTISHIHRLIQLGASIHSHTFMPLVGSPFASKFPGKIHPKYLDLIKELQQKRKLSGFHVKQEKEAEKMSNRRWGRKLN